MMDRNLNTALLHWFLSLLSDMLRTPFQIRDSAEPHHLLVVHPATNSNLDFLAMATPRNRDTRGLGRFGPFPAGELGSISYAP